jgi:hypothetical protein
MVFVVESVPVGAAMAVQLNPEASAAPKMVWRNIIFSSGKAPDPA